ncbi:MAG: hypothetical protein Kow00108_26730 [Calditrichia bacterium]
MNTQKFREISKQPYQYATMTNDDIVIEPFDVTYQKLRLSFKLGDRRLLLRNQTTLHILNPGRLEQIGLDLMGRWKIEDVYPQDLAYTYNGKKFTIQDIGNKPFFSVTVTYSGTPSLYHPWIHGMYYSIDSASGENMYIHTVNPPYGARTWLLSHDSPHDKIDTFVVEALVPEQLQFVSNGRKIFEKDSAGETFIRYQSHYPLASYLTSINVGPYFKHQQICDVYSTKELPVAFYTEKPLSQEDISILSAIVKRGIAFFEKKIGPYPFTDDGLKIVETSFRGGMENQTVISISKLSPDKEYLLIHELAHHWFGNFVTPSFKDVWLSEGMATYLTALYIKEMEGPDHFRAYMQERKSHSLLPVIINNTLVPDSVYDSELVYHKGAWIWHYLQSLMGDQQFFKMLQYIYSSYNRELFSSSALLDYLNHFGFEKLVPVFRKMIFEGFIPEIKMIVIPNPGFNELIIKPDTDKFTQIPIYINYNKINKTVWIGKNDSLKMTIPPDLISPVSLFENNYIIHSLSYR